MKQLLIVFFILTVVVTEGLAQFINGRLVTSAYSWQTQLGNDELGKETSSTRFRATETIQLDIGKNDLVLHTYFQGSNDFGSSLTDDPKIRFHNLYLEKKNLFDIMDIKVGRIPVFAGIGTGAIDGIGLKVKPMSGQVFATAHLGGLTPTDQSLKVISDIGKNYLAKFQLGTYLIPNTSLVLGYLMKSRKAEDFYALRADTMFNTYEILIENSPEIEQYASVDLNCYYGPVNIYGKTEINSRLQRAEIMAEIRVLPTLGLSLDYLYREPRTAYNSIFSVFTQKNTNEIAGGLNYILFNKYNIYARYSFVKYNDDDASRLSLGVNSEYGALSYIKNFGYVGDMDIISADLMYPLLNKKLYLHGGISLLTLKYAQDESSNATTFVLGGNFRPSSSISCDLQGQMLINKVYKNDFRIYFKFGYSFLSKLNIF
jgi:hypothetical protein